MQTKRRFDIWTLWSILILGLFFIFLLAPMFTMFRQAVVDANGNFTLEHFAKFFGRKYYFSTLTNSLKSTTAVTLVSLALGIPLAYVYTFYHLRGQRLLYILSILCCMSAPMQGLC